MNSRLFLLLCASLPSLSFAADLNDLQFRLHFMQRDCNLSTLQFLGRERVPSPAMATDFRTKKTNGGLRLELRRNNRVVRHMAAPNTALLPTTDREYILMRCQAPVVFEVPGSVFARSEDRLAIREHPGWRMKAFRVGDLLRPLQEPVPKAKVSGRHPDRPGRLLRLHGNSARDEAFDFVIVAEGFSVAEVGLASDRALRDSKFGKRAQAIAESLLSREPYRSLAQKINIWALATPSPAAGIGGPEQRKLTAFGTFFGANCIGRLLGVYRQVELFRFVQQRIDADQIILLANTRRYGGSGTFGGLTTITMNRSWEGLLHHELGHALAGLADHYHSYSDPTPARPCRDKLYGDRFWRGSHYDRGTGNRLGVRNGDLVAPNLTLYPDRSRARWADLLSDDSPVVPIAYPLQAAEADAQKHSLRFVFKPHFARPALTLMSGTRPRDIEPFLQAEAMVVNGRQFPRKQWRVRAVRADAAATTVRDSGNAGDQEAAAGSPDGFRLIEIPAMAVPEGENLVIDFHFAAAGPWRKLSTRLQWAQRLYIPGIDFDPQALGLFQGAYASLTDVWRPSFASLMMRTDAPALDPVARAAVAAAIRDRIKAQ